MDEREIDALVASRVLNQIAVWDSKRGELYTVSGDRTRTVVPFFSTDDEATSALMDYLAEKGWEARVRKSQSGGEDVWFASFVLDTTAVAKASHGATKGVAVCRAAIRLATG